MNHLIIGTAGHVDHGKTCLIKALTGIDTDRLEEEKRRGITIELGFASIVLDDGRQAGIVDVPGHEKFIRNMLAGAGGIDLALLVVAADEGVMPQTREHLEILCLLGVHHGVVALTKTDLVDAEWLELVTEDVRGEVKGTFLENAPIVPVSARTGEGLAALRAELTRAAAAVEEKDLSRPFRLPVDRVFSVDGFGTVVTGTLTEGSVRTGDEAFVYPDCGRAKVRNLQVHGKDVEEAFAGQRVAINLAGLKKEKLDRGDTVAAPDSLEVTQLLDVWLTAVRGSARRLESGLRLHLYHGSRAVLCRLTLLGQDVCAPGEGAPAQLRLDEPLACRNGDRFVVRFYSPLETVGGGVILDARPRPHHRKDAAAAAAALDCKAHGSPADKLALALREQSPRCLTAAQYAALLGLGEAETRALLADCGGAVSLAPFSGEKEAAWVGADWLDALKARGEALLDEYHAANPFFAGMPRDELRAKLLGDGCPAPEAVLRCVLARGGFAEEKELVRREGFRVYYTQAQQKQRDALLSAFEAGGFSPPENDALLSGADRETVRQMLRALCAEGRIVLVSPQFYMDAAFVARAKAAFAALQAEKGPVSLADFRDALGTSRKFALPLLEYFDRKGVTLRKGDLRTLA